MRGEKLKFIKFKKALFVSLVSAGFFFIVSLPPELEFNHSGLFISLISFFIFLCILFKENIVYFKGVINKKSSNK